MTNRQTECISIFQRNVLAVAALVAVQQTFLLTAGALNAQEIDTGYGKQRGSDYGTSVNGTSGLIELFRVKGHNVATWRKLSPRLEKYDTIVWMPDNFQVPSQAEIDKLESWLSSGYNRTLVYVGRDYDAEIEYWQNILPQANAEEKAIIRRRIASAQSRHAARRAVSQEVESCDWFELDPTTPARDVTSLQGDWAGKFDSSKVRISLHTRMEHAFDESDYMSSVVSRDLLVSNGDSLVVEITDRRKWPGNKLILVTNGSFLLNLPLVHPENRKLASQLVNECKPAGEVVFLESDESGIPVSDSEREEQSGRAGQWMSVWPLNLILFHFLVIGVVFMYTYVPMFGRAKRTEQESTSDFGKHVESLGQLIRRSGDQNYALSRIEHYQQHVKRESRTK